MMNEEQRYVQKRLQKARFQSIPFYLNRVFPIKINKIVFCCIEGTTGYSCNPKYIAEELIKQNKGNDKKFELVWLVNDVSKKFPKEIKVVKNTLWNRAYHLSTARFWIDNSRKQLEVRKRKGQIYIQTWHAKLGFKPTCLDRGASFSKIAYLVSKHDSDMVDYWLSNSDWYDKILKTGSLYEGKTLRTGS
ncbi:MAG: CDP-glycerol glycerophosphotransferase family protein, partial [Lachnospiraceae bacterium]